MAVALALNLKVVSSRIQPHASLVSSRNCFSRTASLAGHVLLHDLLLAHHLDGVQRARLALPRPEEDLPEGALADGLEDVEVIDGGRERRRGDCLVHLEDPHLLHPAHGAKLRWFMHIVCNGFVWNEMDRIGCLFLELQNFARRPLLASERSIVSKHKRL